MLCNVEKLLGDGHHSRLVSLPDILAFPQTLCDLGDREGEAPPMQQPAAQSNS
jgi:hypothetical protein